MCSSTQNLGKGSVDSIDLKEKIKEAQERITKDVDQINQWTQEYENQRNKNKLFEIGKYQEFLNITEGKQFFSVSHVEQLGLPYEQLIVLSSKNSGKTWEQYRLISEAIKKGIKVFYLRTLRSDVELLFHQFEIDEPCPVIMVKSKNRYFLYDKRDWNSVVQLEQQSKRDEITPTPTKTLFEKHGYREVGYAIDFHRCNSIGGASYPDVELVIYDECLSHHPTIKTKPLHCTTFKKFISSIQRNKKGIKVFCFGNLTQNTALLEYYGINPIDKFRYISYVNPETNQIQGNLIFINAEGIYSNSFANQDGAVQFGSIKDTIEQARNSQTSDDLRIVANVFWPDSNYWMRCIVNNFYIEVRYVVEELSLKKSKERYYGIKSRPASFASWSEKEPLYVDHKFHSKNSPYIVYKEDIINSLGLIFKLFETDKLYFYCIESMKIFRDIYNFWKSKTNNLFFI